MFQLKNDRIFGFGFDTKFEFCQKFIFGENAIINWSGPKLSVCQKSRFFLRKCLRYLQISAISAGMKHLYLLL